MALLPKAVNKAQHANQGSYGLATTTIGKPPSRAILGTCGSSKISLVFSDQKGILRITHVRLLKGAEPSTWGDHLCIMMPAMLPPLLPFTF